MNSKLLRLQFGATESHFATEMGLPASATKRMGKEEAGEGEPGAPHSFGLFIHLFLKKLDPCFPTASAKIPLFLRAAGAGSLADLPDLLVLTVSTTVCTTTTPDVRIWP